MKIIVLGPTGVGKTDFIQKMFSDYDNIKSHIWESNTPIELSGEDIAQAYLILPKDEVLRERCPSLDLEKEVNKWTKYYFDHCDDYAMTWVADF